jgi:signal transduction histidine kinase/CheY-like chemotaxis protein
MAADSRDISSIVQSVREEVVMTTYTTAMVAGTVLMLGNMTRNLYLGNPLSIPHSILYMSFLVIYVLRRRIGARLLAPILLFTLYLAGTFGYFIYGFIGNSAPVYMALCIVASAFYGPRGGLIAAVASGAMMVTAAALALSGHLVFSYDVNAFIGSPASWIAALSTFAAMSAMVLTQVGLMHRNLETLLHKQQISMRDLTQTNVRLEEEIAARTKVESELRRQSALLENILNGLPQGVSVFDEQLKLVVWNEGLINVLELPRELVVRNVRYEDLIRVLARRGDFGPGDPEEQVQKRRELAMRLQPRSFEIVRASGRTHLVVSKPFHIDGKIVGFITTYTDITERKEREKELQKIEKLESLGILAGGIAHDFNNILTGIMGNISFARMFLDATHKSYKPLVEADKASVRAAELAYQLLTFSRGGKPVKKVVSLQHLVNESISLVLRGSNVKGSVDIPDSIHAIKADGGQISQVFNNIIINATQAMPGGGTLTVIARNETLRANNSLSLPPGTYICITFADQGSGISEDDLNRIFDPYFTTKSAGSGLGLATAHSIVSKHGGHIDASSEVGKGATFTIYLPSIGEAYSKDKTDSITQTTGDHRDGSILVMDDEKMIRDMTTNILENMGYQVMTCENGTEAIAQYKVARESGVSFSAVILDLTIPGGMGGKETAQQILAIDPKACLIVSSGYSQDPIMSDYGSYGFAGAVAKPYNIKELGQLLSSVLSMR